MRALHCLGKGRVLRTGAGTCLRILLCQVVNIQRKTCHLGDCIFYEQSVSLVQNINCHQTVFHNKVNSLVIARENLKWLDPRRIGNAGEISLFFYLIENLRPVFFDYSQIIHVELLPHCSYKILSYYKGCE